jgi:hypothetical protein
VTEFFSRLLDGVEDAEAHALTPSIGFWYATDVSRRVSLSAAASIPNIRWLVGRSLTAIRTAREPSVVPIVVRSLMNSPRFRSVATNLAASGADSGR